MGKRKLIFLLLNTGILYGYCSERFPLSLGAKDRLCYFVVALPGPSIPLFWVTTAWVCTLLIHINHISHDMTHVRPTRKSTQME